MSIQYLYRVFPDFCGFLFTILNDKMSTTEEQFLKLEERIKSAENLLKRADKFTAEGLRGARKLCTKIQAELRFLDKIRKGKIEFKDDHLNSTNLTSLNAFVSVAEQISSKDTIFENFHFLCDEDVAEEKRSTTVDIVCNNGTVWMKVIARNAKALLTAWEGRGGFGEKSIISQAELYISAAKSNPCEFCTPKIYFFFCKGVPEKILKGLEKIGIGVRGKVTNDFCEDDDFLNEFSGLNFEESNEICQTLAVNLDVTALISLVSNLCHGSCNLQFGVPVLSEQANEERKLPVLPKIESFLKGKTLYACETATESFQEIVKTIGGPKEKLRATELLKRVQIVPDQPSQRTRLLQNSGKINPRSRAIFGTGDSLKAVTVTANTGFVRAAAQSGVRLNVFVHEARALTEIKEKFAKAIK